MPNKPQVPAKAEPVESTLHPHDAATLQALADVAMSALENWSETTQQTAEIQRETARINAEWREKEIAHEVKLAEISAKGQEADNQREAEWRARRETTIRWVGGTVVVGLLAFLIVALVRDKIADPVSAIPQLVVAFAFVWLLVKQVKDGSDNTQPPSAA